MTVRASLEHPSTPESIKSASIESLTDKLIDQANNGRPLDTSGISPNRPAGYVPAGQEPSLATIVDLQEAQLTLSKLEIDGPLSLYGFFKNRVYRKLLEDATKAVIVPDGATPVYVGHTYQTGGHVTGPYVSDFYSIGWSISINRDYFVYQDEYDTITPIKNSAVTKFHAHESYEDNNRQPKQEFSTWTFSSEELKTANDPKLLAMLQYIATN